MSHPASGVTVRVQSLVVAFAMAFAFAGSAMAQMSDVIISQYVEGGGGSSTNDAIELYNGTGAPINLATGGYKLLRYDNGATTPSATINLSGTVPSRGTRVYVNFACTSSALVAKADERLSEITFTGDDAIVLVKGVGNTVVDSFGDVGDNPIGGWGSGSTDTQGNSLIRKPSLKAGRTATTSTFNPSDQWQADSAGYLNSLGTHLTYHAALLTPFSLTSTGTPTADGWSLNKPVGGFSWCSGEGQGDSGTNGTAKSSLAGAGAAAWQIWTTNGFGCNDSSEIWSTYMLGGVSANGQPVSIQWDHGTVRLGKIVKLEFLNTTDTDTFDGVALQLTYTGGEGKYRVADANPRQITSGFSYDGGTATLTCTGNGGYTLTWRGATITGTLANSVQGINCVRVTSIGANDESSYAGDEGNVYFNNLVVGCTDADNDGACIATDCDDANAAIYPGAPELCATAGVDNDCDGNTAEIDANAADKVVYFTDADNDTYTLATGAPFCTGTTNPGYRAVRSTPLDCDDASAAAYPGAAELCATAGTDNDCDSDANEIDANAADRVTFYADADNDTYTLSTGALFCPGTTNAGYRASASASLDCNDANAAVKPGAAESCDGVDNNCDGTIDPSSCSSITPASNGGSSFGGAIGGSTLNVGFSGANVVFTITRGAGTFDQALVLYVDSAAGGFGTTSGFTDDSDTTRKAVSGYNGSTRATVDFPAGFTADYALYVSPGYNYGGAFQLVNGGSHTWTGHSWPSNSGNTSASTYVVTVPRANLGILPGQQFKFVGTYLNPTTAVRSNEGYGEGLPASGNVSGTATFTTWLTATAPCTGSESLTAPFDGTVGDMFATAGNGWLQSQPCGSGGEYRLTLVRDGGTGAQSTWRGPRFDGSIDSFTAEFRFSFKNGDGATGDGFCFFWGNASDMSGDRYKGGEGGINAFQTDGAGLQVGFKGYTGAGQPGVTPYWGSSTLASTYVQNFDSIKYTDWCYAAADARMARATVAWTRGQGVTVTLQMPGAASATTILNNVGSTTLAGINPSNWYFGFAGRNGAISQDVIIGDFTVTVNRTNATYYVDIDGDGYGYDASGRNACQYAIPAGYIAAGGDCDETDTAINPGAVETCANLGVDDDCDGVNSAAEATDSTTYYVDGDGDNVSINSTAKFCTAPSSGYRLALSSPVDCDDGDALTYPGAAETCANLPTDNDCDGVTTDAEASDAGTYYADADNDTYTVAASTLRCPANATGYRASRSASLDCNDNNPAVKPGATDVCDGVDNNCDGTIDPSSCTSITPSGNGGSSFAGAAASGAIGGSTLDVSFSGANVVFTITKGAAPFGDALVLYIDSATGGFATTSGFTDTDDASRKAISGFNGSTRSTVNFASGFTANYALYISPGTNVYAGAWSLANGGAHTHMGAATMSPTNNANAATYTVTIPRSYLGILPGQQFKFVGTYLNPLTAVRSNEGYGEGLPASGNVSGAATFTTWLTATAPCTGAETVSPSWDGTIGTQFGNADESVLCTGGPGRLRVVIDGQSSTYGTWRSAPFDGEVDSMSASFKFSLRNGGGGPGDGFCFFWGDASDMSGTRWQGGEWGINALRAVNNPGLQIGFNTLSSSTPGVEAKWGTTLLAPIAQQSFSSVNYGGNYSADNTCYASDTSRMATVTVSWTRGSGVTVTLQMPGAASATTILNNVGSATLANIHPENWHFGFAARNGAIDQHVIIGDCAVSVTRTDATYYVDVDGDGYGAVGSDLDACQSAIPAGYIATGGDCDDTSTAIKPGAAETCANLGTDDDCDGTNTAAEASDSTPYYADGDADGYTVSAPTAFCTAPASGYLATATVGVDCNDASAAVYPGAPELCATAGTDNDCDSDAAETDANAADRATFYRDQDGDTYGTSTNSQLACTAPTGYVSSSTDCNDANAAVNPGATEVCDGIDNDCANGVDDGLTAITYYRDVDGDGYGNAGVTTMTCNGTAPSGFVANSTDCDDTSTAIRPGAAELCLTVGTDNNCNGNANDVDVGAADKVLFYRDQDNDTYTLATGANFCPGTTNSGYRAAQSSPLDCDDTNSAIRPGATEYCANDGVDNDCDGEANDDAEAVDSASYYTDSDGDFFGAATATAQKSCSTVSGKVPDNTDCNDGNAAINPGATEVCDSGNVDENCSGQADNNDSGATGKTAFYADNDGDGFGAGNANQRCDAVGNEVGNDGDCDDADATRSPLTVWYPDADQDGRGVLAGAVTQCARPGAQFARAVGDLCPNDALKTDPGTCGCGTVDADTNGNGVPDCSDNTPPAVRLALLTEDANIGSGEKLYVTVALQSGPIQGVGAQVVLAYDRTKLSLDTNFGSGGTFYEIAEGSPLDIPLFAQHDGTAGKLIVALGMGVGNSDLAVGGALLKLRFTCIGDYAGAANAVTFTTWNTFQSSVGNAASQSVGVGAPANLPPVSSTPGRVVLSAVPAPVALWADADGSGSAAVTIVPPTAVDASSQAVNVTWTRSDSGSNLTTFPSGVTTITWSATDATGNTSTATTQVNVSADSVMMADVALGGNYSASAFTRGIQVAARKGSATDTDANTVVLNQSSSGGNYRAEGRVRLAVAGGTDWTTGCAAVRDPLHTLRRALAVAKTTVAGSMGGRSYNSAYVVDGTDPADYLLSGNVDGNAVIDILDYGTFVNQRGVLLPINTYAGAAMPHTDLNGNGQVTLADLTFIQANIFKQDEQCTAAAGETPIRKITVRELRRLGLGDMAAADMNGDGVLDAQDLALAMQGADRTEDAGTPDAEQPAGNAQE